MKFCLTTGGHLTVNPEIVEHCATVTRHVAIVGLLSLLPSFVAAPLTHEHANNAGQGRGTFIHAHFSPHLKSGHGGSEIDHKEKGEVRYLDLFQAQTASPSIPHFCLTSAFRISSESSSYGFVLLIEPNAHAPPLVMSVPARPPPAYLLSHLA